MASHSTILAWETPWTEEPGGLQSMESQRGCKESDTTERTCTHTHTQCQENGYTHTKESSLSLTLHHIQKVTQNESKEKKKNKRSNGRT